MRDDEDTAYEDLTHSLVPSIRNVSQMLDARLVSAEAAETLQSEQGLIDETDIDKELVKKLFPRGFTGSHHIGLTNTGQ